MLQAHIYYSGRVQGVGFRFTVHRYASDLDLKGWVKNLSDGRVEILVQGSRESMETLLKQVEDYFGSYIQNKEIDYQPDEDPLKSFEITF